jgi:hypothetical protein
MKNILFIITALLISSFNCLYAQTSKGTTLLGISSNINLSSPGPEFMNLGFSSIKYKSDAQGFYEPEADKSMSFNLMPRIGFFPTDGISMGLDLSLAYSNQTDGESAETYSSNVLCGGPFLRIYTVAEKVLPYFEGSCGFGVMNESYSDGMDSDENKSNILTYGGCIGMAVLVGEKSSLDISAGYHLFSIKDARDNPDDERAVLGTIGLKIGFTLLLGKN